jgi:putative tryptophan/tyrosine transport system substrate-binding protein
MRRREFIGLVGAVAAWPVVARGQPSGEMRRIGVLWSHAKGDSETKRRFPAFHEGLQNRGWREGKNIHIDYRFAAGRTDQFQSLAKELVALRPDVIFVQTTPLAVALQRENGTIPAVFVNVSDPIGSGLVASLARPGGNFTGVMLYEEGIVGKWLALLKEIAPSVTRAAVMADPKKTPYDYFLRSAKSAAASLGIEIVPSPIASASNIEQTITSFAQTHNGGVVVLPDGTTIANRDLVVALMARHRLPAVYPFDFFVSAGGLMSYGTDVIDQTRRASSYIDRILRGDKPADLPVQAPTLYKTSVNIKTAEALGLVVPPSLLVRADEVIQ